MPRETEDTEQFSIVEKLVHLGRVDWKYSDLYLREAERALAPLCTRARFQAMQGRRSRVTQLGSDLRRAILQGDWSKAERLAGEGDELRGQIERSSRLLSLARRVYGKRSFDPSITALALSGVVAQPARSLEREVARLIADLRTLDQRDDSHREFYQRRAAEFDRLVVDLPENPPPTIDPSELRKAALASADEADFAAVVRIARSASRGGMDRLGRLRAPRPAVSWARRLAEAIPEGAIEGARRLGFEAVELEPNDAFNAYLSCCCADRAILAPRPLTEERLAIEGCTCGHACPPEIGRNLKTSLDALMVHPFVTSGGTRYLPWFGPESLLVEVFPEGDPDALTPLLEALALPRRRALARLEIEHALLSRGPQVCEDLGLDSTAFRIVCIPFDVYKRLSDRYSWGSNQLWTHFDGYQVTRELRLQALVGGDVRFGGPDDLCGVGRAYDSEHITARFAAVRRDRFEARESRDELFGADSVSR